MTVNKDGNLEFKSEFKKINTARNVFNETNHIISMFLDCAIEKDSDYIITRDCVKKVSKSLSLYLQRLLNEQNKF